MATVYDIIKGINQAAANAYDGSHEETLTPDGRARVAGLNKAITGDTLTLTKEGDHHILVQRISNYRTDVQAHCDYRIGGISEVDLVEAGDKRERLDQAVRDWLSLGRSESTYTGGKVGNTRPKNDTRKGK